MATIIRGAPDDEQLRISEGLSGYERDHPGARAELYRQNAASIRVRIIDAHFAGSPRLTRKNKVEKYLKNVDDETKQQITLFLLLAPSELQSSLMNIEFEDPVPSGL